MIAHSLGNFVFDMDFMEQTMEGVTLDRDVLGRPADAGRRSTPYRMDARFAPRLAERTGRRRRSSTTSRTATGPFRRR